MTAAGLAAEPEELVVTGQRVYPTIDVVALGGQEAVDTAELLQQLPGADFNANGRVTGIAQYRGLFGDRVAINIDGLETLSGGPNAMDAPFSYASPLLLEHLSLERGIASVSSAAESIGGHINTNYDRGTHSGSTSFSPSGAVQTRYESNGGFNSTAARVVAANDRQKFALLAERDQADDFDYPDGEITPTQLERERYDLSYGFRGESIDTLLYAGRLDIENTGTPALPMDIRFIKTDVYGAHIKREIGRSSLDVAVGYSDVGHRMDNFSLRTPPQIAMNYRATHALADGYRWRIGSETDFEAGELRFGVDGSTATHSSTITNPNVGPFRVDNFNNAERDLIGVYGQWNRLTGNGLDLEAGVRVNQVTLDAGPVAAHIPPMNPMMQMMGMNATMLANAFNSSDLDRSHTNVDAVLKIGRGLTQEQSVYLELAQKTRAPSYQEAYLWLPMQATGGLADGRNYIGNPALESEVSHEINVGTNWRSGKGWIAPQVFYKDISDYIQGIPSTNTIANRVSMMMSGAPALEFSNTDAEIYGIDLAWGYYLSDALTIEGTLSYVRGQRTDIDDDLYRLAPLNGAISVLYERGCLSHTRASDHKRSTHIRS